MRSLLRRWLTATHAKKPVLLRIRKTPLALEMMEQRDVPAALTWTADGDGVFWSDPNNWEEVGSGIHRIPTSTDILHFSSLDNFSSVDDINVTVSSIIQDNSYTGDLLILEGVALSVTGNVTAYGGIEIDGSLDAGNVILIGGDITITAEASVPLTTYLLDMTNGATLTLSGDGNTLAVESITMGGGTTFTTSFSVTIDGSIGSSGSIILTALDQVTVTGDFTQAAGGYLYMPGFSALTVLGSSPVILSGHTVVENFGDPVSITAETVYIDGPGILQMVDFGDLLIVGDLEVRSGTIQCDVIGAGVAVKGNFTCFIGTLSMTVNPAGQHSGISATGTVQLGPEDGGGGPILNLNQLGPITSPTTFFLIFADDGGNGDFDAITAIDPVIANGWAATTGISEVYFVTLT